jgi:translation elongation factor EF-Tu-like GTPase
MPSDKHDEPFVMVIEDFFDFKERGIAVVGHIKSGNLRKAIQFKLVGWARLQL